MKTPSVGGWSGYIQHHLDVRGWTNADLARAAGIDRSQIGRWLNGETREPRIEQVRAVAKALGRDIREGLIVAGYFSADEMNIRSLGSDLRMFTDDELVAEVHLRLRTRRGGGAQEADVDVTEVDEQFGVDTSEVPEDPAPQPRNPFFRAAR